MLADVMAEGTAKTDETPVLSVLAVRTEVDATEILIIEDPRTTARRKRLIRWGWSTADAEALAQRLARRDQEHDGRVSCIDCAHYRAGHCCNHRQAALHSPQVGRDLAEILQRCSGFRRQKQSEAQQ